MSRNSIKARGILWTIISIALAACWGFGLYSSKVGEFKVTDQIMATWLCFALCSLSSINALLCFVQLNLNYSCIKSIDSDRFLAALYGGAVELLVWTVLYNLSIGQLVSVMAAYVAGAGVAVWIIVTASGLERSR